MEKNRFDVDSIEEDQKEFLKNKLILKTLQRFKGEKHNIFTEEINKIVLSSNNDNRMRSIDSIKTYAYRKSKNLI